MPPVLGTTNNAIDKRIHLAHAAAVVRDYISQPRLSNAKLKYCRQNLLIF